MLSDVATITLGGVFSTLSGFGVGRIILATHPDPAWVDALMGAGGAAGVGGLAVYYLVRHHIPRLVRLLDESRAGYLSALVADRAARDADRAHQGEVQIQTMESIRQMQAACHAHQEETLARCIECYADREADR